VTERCSRFKEVSYANLNARQKELFSFQKIAATLADYGFNCIKLSDDWLGADFIAYNVTDTTTLKVQLKSRLTIGRKYCGKEIWIAFPHGGYWYLMEHDLLIEKVGEHTDWLNSDSWKIKNGYHSTSINSELLKSIAEDRLGPVYGAILDV
jgi:frataxin-like iron-binding protein CyaY